MKKRGFTLVELLVVISIIGILATIVGMNYNGAQARARDSKRMSDLSSIKSALAMYKADKKHYPTFADNTIPAGCATAACNGTVPSGLSGYGTSEQYWAVFQTEMANYLATLPQDPKVGQVKKSTAASIPYSYFYKAGSYNTGSTCTTPGMCYTLFARPLESTASGRSSNSECTITDASWNGESYLCLQN